MSFSTSQIWYNFEEATLTNVILKFLNIYKFYKCKNANQFKIYKKIIQLKNKNKPSYEKKSSNFCAIFVQLHTETVQFLQFLGQKPPYDFHKKTKT